MAEKQKKVLAVNRKARHDYFVDDTYEAGIALFGTEVKSLRAGTVNLKDSYIDPKDGELWAIGIHISPYEKGNVYNRDPLRNRKLLMHKREILKLSGHCPKRRLYAYSSFIVSFRIKCKGRSQV